MDNRSAVGSMCLIHNSRVVDALALPSAHTKHRLCGACTGMRDQAFIEIGMESCKKAVSAIDHMRLFNSHECWQQFRSICHPVSNGSACRLGVNRQMPPSSQY